MNQLPSPPLFSNVLYVLGCGVTGELALLLACHRPSPSMESRGGVGGGGRLLHYLMPFNNSLSNFIMHIIVSCSFQMLFISNRETQTHSDIYKAASNQVIISKIHYDEFL